MRSITHISLAVVLFMIGFQFKSVAQQDPKFNQYMFNPLGINPAYAGSREVISGVLLFRNQWIGFDGAPTSQAFSIHAPLANKKMGLGFQMSNDKIGARSTVNMEFDYAYRFPLFKGKMAFGLGGGFNYYTFDWNMVSFKESSDAISFYGVRQIIRPDANFGAFYNTKKMYIGFEIAHLLEPSADLAVSDSLLSLGLAFKQFRHLTITAGHAFVLNKRLTLKPSFLYKQAGLYRGALDLNLSLLIDEKLWVGVTARPTYGAVAIVEYVFADKFRLGYSFDYPFNSLRYAYGSSHELFLGIDLALPRSMSVSPRYF